MPLFEFRCGACKTVFEVLENSPPHGMRRCPHCNGPAVRNYCAPVVKYNGEGFSKSGGEKHPIGGKKCPIDDEK